MRANEAAYVAGIIDGEGSIYLERFKAARSKTSLRRNLTPWQYRIAVCMLMTDRKTVEYVAAVTGCNISVRKLPAKYNEKSFRRTLTAYSLTWRNSTAQRLLFEIFPYLIGKKDKAGLALVFQERYAPGRGKPFQKRLIPKYEALRKKISAA